jgi:hypothetical protein
MVGKQINIYLTHQLIHNGSLRNDNKEVKSSQKSVKEKDKITYLF